MTFIGKAYNLPRNSMRPRDQVLSHSISLEQTSDVTTVKKETLSFLCLLSSKIPRKEQICHVRASSVYSVELPTTLKDPAYSGKYQKTINIVVVGNGSQRSVLQMFQDEVFLKFFPVCFGKPPKKVKKLHNKCELSPKMEDPLPLFHNNFSRFRNLKINVFLQLLRVYE